MVSRVPQNGFISPAGFAGQASPGRSQAAEAVGQDKGQISRALANLLSRKLIAKSANPKAGREVLISLTVAGIAAHAIGEGAGAQSHALLRQVDQLTAVAAEMLESEKSSR